MFLEKSELNTVGLEEIINLITRNDEKTVETIIEENIDVMSTYLFQYYDTETIFNATGKERSKTLLKHLKALVMHDIYTSRSREFNETAKIKAEEALLWLEKVSSGKIKPDLPVKKEDTNGDGNPDKPVTFLKLGSRKNYANGW